jgi:hypothetical protein
MVTSAELDLLHDAEHTLGVFTRRTATSFGVPDHVVDHRIRSGQWELTQPSTLRVMGSPLTFEGDVLAAVLSAHDQAGAPDGRIAAASHATAARLLGLRAYAACEERDPIEVTVTGTTKPTLWWDCVVHRTASLPPCDTTLVGAVPCTTGTRFLIDTAPCRTWLDVCGAADDVIGARLATRAHVHARATALASGRRNVARLRDATGPDGAARFRSWLERYGHGTFDAAGLPPGEWNVPIRIGGETVALADVLHRAARVIVELDGFAFHSTPADVARDKARDRRLAIAGYLVLRYTYRELVHGPDAVVAEIREALRARV